MSLFFFFNDTATTEIYTLSLHDALPIGPLGAGSGPARVTGSVIESRSMSRHRARTWGEVRSSRSSSSGGLTRRAAWTHSSLKRWMKAANGSSCFGPTGLCPPPAPPPPPTPPPPTPPPPPPPPPP